MSNPQAAKVAAAKAEPKAYLMLADAFIDGVRRRKGEIITYGGTPSKVMKAAPATQAEG